MCIEMHKWLSINVKKIWQMKRPTITTKETKKSKNEATNDKQKKKNQNHKNPVEEKNGGSGVASVSPALKSSEVHTVVYCILYGRICAMHFAHMISVGQQPYEVGSLSFPFYRWISWGSDVTSLVS